jgi:hypothetical protein
MCAQARAGIVMRRLLRPQKGSGGRMIILLIVFAIVIIDSLLFSGVSRLMSAEPNVP